MRRLKDVLKQGPLKYFIQHTGPGRAKRREVDAKSRRKKTGKKAAPKNWNRNKHKRRKEQKRRRKQSWRV
jgi:hypothetical protein